MRLHLLVLGNIENHGQHLPCDVDTVISKHISERILFELGTKKIKISVVSKGLGGVPPRNSYLIDEYYKKIKNKIKKMVKNSKHILIINSHYPNNFIVQQILEELGGFYKKAILIDVWKIISKELNKKFDEKHMGHGGAIETSLYTYATNTSVSNHKNNISALEDYKKWKNQIYWKYPIKFSDNGVYGIVDGFSKEIGKFISNLITKKICKIIQSEFLTDMEQK